MRLKEGEPVKKLEQGMKSKWNWSLKEKPVQELVWSSWIKKAKKEKKKRNFRGGKRLNSTKREKSIKQRLEAWTIEMNVQRNAEIISSPK